MFETNNFQVARKVVLPNSTINVQCNLTCGDDIEKILSVSGQACLASSEAVSGSVNYSAYVDVCLVYLNKDGEIGKINSTCPFSSKITNDKIENGQKPIILLKVLDLTVEGVSGDTINAQCTIEENCVMLQQAEVHSVKSADEDICVKCDSVKVVNLQGESSTVVNVESTLALRENAKRLILTESQVLVKEAQAGNGFVSVNGDVVVRILYLSESDRFESSYIYDSFKEEVAIENATVDSKVEAYAQVNLDSVKVTLDQDEKGAKVAVDTPISLVVKAYGQSEVEVIKDIYSTKNQLAITTTSFDNCDGCASTLVEGKIDGSLTLQDEQPRVDKIMFVGGNSVVVTNSYIKDDEIYIEGIAKSNVVYLNDESSSLNSVAIEVPFVLTDKTQWQPDGHISTNAVVCDVDVVVKKGRELFYDAKIKASANYCNSTVSGVISQVALQEELPAKDCGMELVFAQAGQDAWEVAKSACVKEELLRMQNPDVIFPLQTDQNLVLFYQKTI